jgi:hypothetical protein
MKSVPSSPGKELHGRSKEMLTAIIRTNSFAYRFIMSPCIAKVAFAYSTLLRAASGLERREIKKGRVLSKLCPFYTGKPAALCASLFDFQYC